MTAAFYSLRASDEIRFGDHADVAPDSTLVKRTLSKWNVVTCGAPTYLESHGAPRTPSGRLPKVAPLRNQDQSNVTATT